MTEQKTERRKKAELPQEPNEGALLYHLITRDHRSLLELSKLLGVEQTYLSTKRLQGVKTLSSKVATAATKLWGLSPDYFERFVNDEETKKRRCFSKKRSIN